MTFYPTKLNNTPQDNKYLVEFIHGYFLWGRESRDNGQQTTDNCTRADLLHRDATIVPSGDELRVLATPMADGKQHTDYDQLILETKNGLDYWIHVSCRKNRGKNRHQAFVN